MKKLFLSLFVVYFSLPIFSKNFEESPAKETTANSAQRVSNSSLSVKIPKYIFSGLNTNVDLVFNNPADEKLSANNYDLFFIINGEDTKVHFDQNGVGTFNHNFSENENLSIYFEDFNYSATLHIIPIWYVAIPVGLLVAYLAYKLLRSGRKKKSSLKPIEDGATEEDAKEKAIASAPKITVKKVVEQKEEIFA
jgi:hypothetical protein